MSTNDLCYMSATEAIKEFRALSLSPVELLDAIINRAEAISESVNPFADRYFDEARVRAKNAETLYLKKNTNVKPLEGIPLVVKDICEISGKRTTRGSLIYSQNVSQQTSVHVTLTSLRTKT